MATLCAPRGIFDTFCAMAEAATEQQFRRRTVPPRAGYSNRFATGDIVQGTSGGHPYHGVVTHMDPPGPMQRITLRMGLEPYAIVEGFATQFNIASRRIRRQHNATACQCFSRI